MVGRAKRHARFRAAAVAVAVALVAGGIGLPARAQPAGSAADIAQARTLYEAGEAAVRDSRFDDAAFNYGASYELSRDPALLFKIGRANERAGRCEVALTYYARYLRDGAPTAQFVATTNERITACGGDPAKLAPPPPTPPPPSPAEGSDSANAGSASAGSASAGAASTGDETGSAAGSAASRPLVLPSRRHQAAWVLTGSAIALVTLGSVLAYAAGSSENDVRDLYAGFSGRPPSFDAETQKRYADLVDQGRRYEHLSWASFGVAGAAALGAAYLFVTGRRSDHEPTVAPVVTPGTAGVRVRF